jgi:hypothetical protein
MRRSDKSKKLKKLLLEERRTNANRTNLQLFWGVEWPIKKSPDVFSSYVDSATSRSISYKSPVERGRMTSADKCNIVSLEEEQWSETDRIWVDNRTI